MKVCRIIALTALFLALLTGCDAVRSALGKPTSKDIAELRLQKARMQRTGDSLAVEMGALPDSLDNLALAEADTTEPAAETSGAVAEAAPLNLTSAADVPQGQATEAEEAPSEGLASGYYVVLGSFKNEDNARYYYNSLSASGADVHLVKMKNGFTAVMICHGSTYDEAYSKMLEFYSDKKRPEDIWIYNTAKKMHLE